MADPFQALFNQYVMQTPDGRYFLPFANTYSGMQFNRTGSGFVGDGGYQMVSRNDDTSYQEPTGSSYTSLNDYFNALDPNNGGFYVTGTMPDGTPINPVNAQNALIDTNSTRGMYNGAPGYFFDPASIGGINPATTSGGKPGETGLMNLLGIAAGAAGGAIFGAGTEVGSSAFGEAANVPVAAGAAGAGAGAGVAGAEVSGSSGNSTLTGSAGSDSISTGGNVGYFDDYTGQYVDYSSVDPYGTGVDFSGNPTGQYAPSTFTGDTANTGFSYDPNYSQLAQKYGPQIAKLLMGNSEGGLGGLLGGGGLGGLGGLLGGSQSIGSTLPGMLALAYASQQPGIDTSRLSGVFDAAGANAPLFTQAAIDPVQKNIAAGYGDLLQSQAQRGIRGSSFGNTDIANYMDITGRTLGDVGATAAQKALGLQGGLAGNIAELQAQSQQMKNNLYGRAFDVLGRGLNPKGYSGFTLNQ